MGRAGANGADAGAAPSFGCTSFPGANAVLHAPALAWLHQTALGSASLRPATLDPQSIPLPGSKASSEAIPALLRFYLGLGGWVADHAIVDRDLNTVHVFTALDLATLPPQRAKSLRRLAEQGNEGDMLGPC